MQMPSRFTVRFPASRRAAILRVHAPLAALALVLALALTLALVPRLAHAGPSLVPVSSDPYTDAASQHKTEVEPDTYAYGNTIVFAFQTARYFDGGSDDIGWATSNDGGNTWHNGFLPGITVSQGGSYPRVSDPAVAYDPYHGLWMISSLAIDSTISGAAVLVSTSPDGLHWSAPVQVANADGGFFDKDWITCYVNPFTPLTGSLPGNNKSLGHCYVEWDLASNGDQVMMSTSSDGGKTWSAAIAPNNVPLGLGGQPVVQPNGNVVVPYLTNSGDIDAFMSTNAGASWTSAVVIAATTTACDAKCHMRSEQLPTAQVGPSGTVYVMWSDCRFESGCAYNDIVMSSSSNGTAWSAPAMVPIDAAGSGIDHILPGLGVDRFTLGPGDHLGVVYYEFPNAACNPSSNCTLNAGYISSTNGGSSWSAPTTLVSGINMLWLAQTNSGYMVGDYESVAFSGGHAFPCFAVASAPSGTLLENMDTATGLGALGGSRLAVKAPAGAVMPRGGIGRAIAKTLF